MMDRQECVRMDRGSLCKVVQAVLVRFEWSAVSESSHGSMLSVVPALALPLGECWSFRVVMLKRSSSCAVKTASDR